MLDIYSQIYCIFTTSVV